MTQVPLEPPRPIVAGVEGVAVTGEERRRTPGQRRRRDRLRAAVVRTFVRERRLGRLLDRQLSPVAIVLHARRLPGSPATIDHLVVAATGVWVIHAVHEPGRVERRKGAGGTPDVWLRTRDGRRVDLVGDDREPVEVVGRVLERMGFGWLDVHRVVCLTNADWGVHARSLVAGDTLVTWGRRLARTIPDRGSLGPGDMKAVAVELNGRLPSLV